MSAMLLLNSEIMCAVETFPKLILMTILGSFFIKYEFLKSLYFVIITKYIVSQKVQMSLSEVNHLSCSSFTCFVS